MTMIYRQTKLLFILFFVECSIENQITEWICTTDYQAYNDSQIEACLSPEGKEIPCPQASDIITSEPIIYNSLEECEIECPVDSIQIETLNQDGMQSSVYIKLYCQDN